MRGRPAPQSLDDFLGIVLTAFRSDYRMSTYENASWRRLPPSHVALSFMRMSVSIRGMFVSELAMFQSCSCVLLGICMLTERVMVLCLMMMMRGGMVVSGRLVMMLTRWMFR